MLSDLGDLICSHRAKLSKVANIKYSSSQSTFLDVSQICFAWLESDAVMRVVVKEKLTLTTLSQPAETMTGFWGLGLKRTQLTHSE